ncbi:MAG: hypothetical protein JWO22_2591, partial [Frankiales bacterium]|nr:hypothetical protein [Frankiales bacterium]
VEPKGVREVSYPVRADVRGRYRVGPLSVRLTDPFGLVELTRSFSSTDDLVVTPVVSPLPSIRLGGDWTGGGDATARSVAATGTDDAATREYRHGDDLRKVHWRSTARVGELMVRREEQPFQSRATMLLDSRVVAHRGDGPGSSFEWAVSGVASIAANLGRAGYGLRVLLETGLDLVPASSGLGEGAVLDALAGVQASRSETLEAATDQLRRNGVDGVLVAVVGALTPDDSERLARLRHGATACVAVLIESETWAPSGPRRREEARLGYEASAGLLTAAGWRVLRVAHGTTLASVWPLAATHTGRTQSPVS